MSGENFKIPRSNESAGGYSSSCPKDSFYSSKRFCAWNMTQLSTPAKSYSEVNNGRTDDLWYENSKAW